MPLCFSFAGVAGNFPFEIGAARALLMLHGKPAAYAGVSSGSVLATFLALGYNPDSIHEQFLRFSYYFDRWWKTPLTWWLSATTLMFSELLPPDAYRQVSGKLYIGYSVLTTRGLEPRVVSTFTSNQDIIDAVLTSCHLFPYAWSGLRYYRGELACDGVHTCGLIKPEGYTTIGITTSMVSAHCAWHDWLPTLDEQKALRLQGTGYNFVMRYRNYFSNMKQGDILTAFSGNPFRRWRRGAMWLCLLYFWMRFPFLNLKKRVLASFASLRS